MKRLALFLSLWCVPAVAGDVVVSIKPLHSLAAGVMEGSGIAPVLLVDGRSSLHDFSLKPSQARRLRHADLLLYMGDDFELFLRAPQPARKVAMAQARGMMFHTVRGGAGKDMHAWLSPANAKAMTAEMARALSETYPVHAALFEKNARALAQKLDALDQALRARMAGLAGKSFATFHDATQYFDRAYGLEFIGAVALHPERALKPRQVKNLRAHIQALGAVCVFAEPEFDAKIVESLVRGTSARSGTIDPEGALLTPGAGLYFSLMEGLASQLETCLKRGA